MSTSVVQNIPHTGPHDLINGVIERFAEYRPRLEEAAARGQGVAVAGVRIRPPLPRPVNIDCMAVNYMEDGTRTEPAPINAFHKSPNAIIGHGDTMVLPDVPATIFEGEAELAVVIGKRAKNVKAADAMNYVFGYTNFIDGSARGLPPPGNVFYQMKSRDTFAPIGPYLVTADEIRDPHKLQVRLSVNGTLKQNFNTDDMAHKIPRCIEWVSSIHTLEPGDILATGTNHRGLSSFMDGDVVELEVEGLGKLRINVRDDLKRTWSRETRLDMQNKKAKEVTTPQLTGKYAAGEGLIRNRLASASADEFPAKSEADREDDGDDPDGKGPCVTWARTSRGQVDLATTRPGTPGGIFMRQFWHAIHRSEDLPAGHAKPIRIMSEDYALYRGESGKAQVIDYRCPHRGAPMHLGWVEDDEHPLRLSRLEIRLLRPVHRAAGGGGGLRAQGENRAPTRRVSILA